VANALSDSKRGAVKSIHSGFERGQSVDDSEPAILMAVPIYLHVFAGLVYDRSYVTYQSADAFGCRVSNGVADANAPRAGFDGRRVQRANRVGMSAGRILGHVHDGKPVRSSELDCIFGGSQHHLERPAFGVLSNRAGSYKGAGFDRCTHLLGDVDDGLNVGANGSGGAIGTDVEFVVDNFLCESCHVGGRARSGSGKTDVG